MDTFSTYIALSGIILLCGVSLNRFSKFLKMPILICFLGAGILFGRYGLKWIPTNIALKDVQLFGEIALCFIIFSGGLQTSFAAIKRIFVTGTLLSTVGVILTAAITAFFTYWISRASLFLTLNVTASLLVGAVFASTDAAAVFAILRGQKASIPPKLQSLLEYESGSNDPAAFLLTLVILKIFLSTRGVNIVNVSWHMFCGITWGLGIGALSGLLLGIFGQWFYNWVQKFLEYNGLRFVVAIAFVLICYGITNGVLRANSLMACYVAGITMGNMRFNYKTTFVKLIDGVAWLMQILLFTLLGSFFDCRMLLSVRNIVGAVLIALTLMFIARPLAVMICMIKSPFSFRERLFTCWVGIRGSAPIMLAALVVAMVPTDGVMNIRAYNFFYMVFTVVLLSILIQGSSLMWVAKKLGLVLPYEEKEPSLLEYDERSDGRDLCQFTVTENNSLIGRALAKSGLAQFALLLMIKRGDEFIQPRPEVVLQTGDVLTFLGDRRALQELRECFFPNEEYTSPETFRQLWDQFSKKYSKRFRNKLKRKTAR